MKVLMLNPPFFSRYSRQSRSPCVTKGGTFYYPYYLAYGTATLEQANIKVKLVDAVANDWSHEDTIKFAKQFNPELTVLDTSTPSIKNDVEVARKLKEALPETHISLGGIHATNLPEETLKMSPAIDSIIIREYEYTVVDLARALEDGKSLNTIDGISFRENGNIIHNKERMPIQDLDNMPFVSWVYKKHFGKKGIKKYFYASIRWPEVTILTSRGCLYNCSFCNIPFKKSYRMRSPENVVEEFEYIQNELPFVEEIQVEDDTFPLNKQRTLEMCDLITKNKIKLTWSCNARVNTDEETLRAMKKAGCRLLCVGFESATQDVLNAIRKGTTKNMQLEFMHRVRKTGLLVNGCFIMGLPNDTTETMRATLEMAKILNPDTAQFYPMMVYPGTESYDWAKQNGHLLTEDYGEWLTSEGWHNTTVSREDLPREVVLQMCDISRKEYYVRPKFFAYKVLQSLTNFEEAKRTLKSFGTFSKWLLKKGFKARTGPNGFDAAE